MRIDVGSVVPGREFGAVGSGALVAVPDPEHLVHLQFRRFAGCPICHLHLRSVVLRNAEIEAAGVREVVVFHSPVEELRPHVEDLPFPVVADPAKRLYAEFGVESSYRSLLSPRGLPRVLRAIGVGGLEMLRGRARPPVLLPGGGRFGLPADFLITPGGRVVARKYGEHADDQWTVDQLLVLAGDVRGVSAHE